jgi:hypothetical protein
MRAGRGPGSHRRPGPLALPPAQLGGSRRPEAGLDAAERRLFLIGQPILNASRLGSNQSRVESFTARVMRRAVAGLRQRRLLFVGI